MLVINICSGRTVANLAIQPETFSPVKDIIKMLLRIKRIFRPLLVAIFSECVESKNDNTRGLGVYPGRPAEYFGPQVAAGASEYRNVALCSRRGLQGQACHRI